jgi:hypothetical protein
MKIYAKGDKSKSFKGFKYDHQPKRSPISISSSSSAGGGGSSFFVSAFLASFLGSAAGAGALLEPEPTSATLYLNYIEFTLIQWKELRGS